MTENHPNKERNLIKYGSCFCKISVMEELMLSDQALCFSGRAYNVIWVWNERARYKLLLSDICNFSSIRPSHSGGYVHQFVLGHFLNAELKHKLKCCAQQERTAKSESETSHLDSIDLDMLPFCAFHATEKKKILSSLTVSCGELGNIYFTT